MYKTTLRKLLGLLSSQVFDVKLKHEINQTTDWLHFSFDEFYIFTSCNFWFKLPGEEITLEYQFKVDSELEPEKFRLAHTVFYETDKRPYTTTFYNQVSDVRIDDILSIT